MSGGRRLRVLAVTDFYLPRQGGVERVVHETARRLPAAGIEVEVLTRRLTAAAAAEERIDGVAVARVGPPPGPLARDLLLLPPAVRRWGRRHLGRFDLVHAHLSLLAWPLVAALAARKLPLVATFYGPWRREYQAEVGHPAFPSRWPAPLRPLATPLIGRLLEGLQRRVIGAAAAVVVLSDHSRRELSELGYNDAAPVTLVPGGVDVAQFAPRERAVARRRRGLPDGAGPVLVAVRRLVPRMGLETLVAAVRLLAPSHPRLRLLIAGEGPLEPFLRRVMKRVG